MPTLVCVTNEEKNKNKTKRSFCFTDCGPADSCGPDDIDAIDN